MMFPALNMKEKQSTKLYVNKIAVVLLAMIVLGTPITLRGIDNINGVEPYFNQRLSDIFERDKLPDIDPLSFASRPFVYPLGTPFLLHMLEKLLPGNIALNILPFLLGVLTISLLFSILKKFGFNDKLVIIANIVFVFSPPFIYNFSVFNSFTIPIFLNVLAIFLFMTDKRIFRTISTILFLTIPFFGYIHVIFSLIFLFLYGLKKIKRVNLLIFTMTLLTGLVYFSQLSSGLFFGSADERDILLRVISEFGGNFGISIFSILTLVFGLRHLWKSKYKYKDYYVSLTVLLLLFLFNQKSGIYFMLCISPILSMGIIEINQTKWESGIIKYLTIILLISGLVFSGLSFLSKIPQLPPNKDMINSLEFLRDRTNPGDIIFSHQNNGILINSIARRPNIIDLNSAYAPNVKERLKDSKTLFYTRDFEIAKSVIEKYNIKYVYITPDMKNGLVWNEPEEGLLFVLEFSGNNFKKVYNNNEVEVWRVNFLQ